MTCARMVAKLVAVLVVAGLGGLGGPAHAAGDRATSLVIATTGTLGQELPREGATAPTGFRLFPARAQGRSLRTWAQRTQDGMRFVAELAPGMSDATYPSLVPEDMTMRSEADGSVAVLSPEGQMAGHIAAPWALDANGKTLRTHYVVDGRDLRQVVDTRDAAYPIIMDPWVTTGWWYTTPVYYVELSWSETWSLKLTLDRDTSSVPALLCGYIPSVTGRIACGAVYILVKSDVKATVNAAIGARQCYKARIPATGGAIAMPAYDSYYKTCIR